MTAKTDNMQAGLGPRKTKPKKVAVALSSLLLAVVALVGFSTPASATAPLLYNQSSTSVPTLCQDQGCGTQGTAYWAPNGTNVTMSCYADVGNYTGNYTSNRYFFVYISGKTGRWFVHSSYVYYQTTVGPC